MRKGLSKHRKKRKFIEAEHDGNEKVERRDEEEDWRKVSLISSLMCWNTNWRCNMAFC
jgi:hypothetical protein